VSLLSEEVDGNDVGLILWEAKAGESPEWKNIANHNPTYKGYLAQLYSLVVRDDVLECHCESAESKRTQIVLLQSKLKVLLGEVHRRYSGGRLGVRETQDKVRQWYFWLHKRNDMEM
jgi:hypothetical protein